MSEELDLLKLVAARLADAGIPYMVSGSTALSLYAEPRMTRDIDIVVELTEDDVARVADLFSEDFYCDADMIREAVARQGTFNLIHTDSVIKVDLIVRKGTAYRREEFARRRAVRIDEATIWFVAPEDLLLSKLAWAKESRSAIQLGDVRSLIACVADLDWPYVERWASDLTVCALLREVRS